MFVRGVHLLWWYAYVIQGELLVLCSGDTGRIIALFQRTPRERQSGSGLRVTENEGRHQRQLSELVGGACSHGTRGIPTVTLLTWRTISPLCHRQPRLPSLHPEALASYKLHLVCQYRILPFTRSQP